MASALMPSGVVVLLCAAAIGWAAIVAWLIRRAARQFRAYRELKPEPSQTDATLPPITVVIPARNEAHVIGRCIAALAAQDYPTQALEAVIVDDNSQLDLEPRNGAAVHRYSGRARLGAGARGSRPDPDRQWLGPVVLARRKPRPE